jgi:hypothetical protein
MALVHHADRRAQLPRRAVAALKGVALDESLLNRVDAIQDVMQEAGR